MSKRKGFRREAPQYKLVFEDEDFDGLEVVTKSLSLGMLFEMQGLQEKAATDPAASEKVLRTLSGAIVSWNLLDDDDQPVPCDYSGLASLDMPFVLDIMEAWMTAMASVPKARLNSSNSGGTSLEQSIPMEVS